MHADNFSLADYLARIRYNGTPTPDIGTVASLMRHQLFSVPFRIWTSRPARSSRLCQRTSSKRSSIANAAATATKLTVYLPWRSKRLALNIDWPRRGR